MTGTVADLDPIFLAEMRKLSCLACGKDPPSDAHHIKSRGAGGKDDFYNVIPLCRFHHTAGSDAWHNIGAISFIYRFPWVMSYLVQLGWQVHNDRLIPPLIVRP